MSLPLLHRRPPLVPGPVTIPATPTVVYAEMIARYITVHRLDLDAHTTACGLSLWPFWRLTLTHAKQYEPHFCDQCWPGYRCVVCGVPSGQADECRHCLVDDVEAEKRQAA